jgi:hypothetical protein
LPEALAAISARLNRRFKRLLKGQIYPVCERFIQITQGGNHG